tara:strand:- start:16 stop:264 length:249 start_codon:yes stop_codon:yes gene_type:complete
VEKLDVYIIKILICIKKFKNKIFFIITETYKMIVSPLGYMIYYQDKKESYEMKKIKKKKLIKDYEIKINETNNIELIIKYFA